MMISWQVESGVLVQGYFDMTVIIAIFVRKGVSTAISHVIHLGYSGLRDIPLRQTNKLSVAISSFYPVLTLMRQVIQLH
jgi:hypothetical protein